MAHPMTLPTLALISIAGAGAGVYLGSAAISEIDPVYFSSPAPTRFFADLTPTPYQGGEPNWDDAGGDIVNDVNVSSRTSCANCQRNFVDAVYAANASDDYVPVDAGSEEPVPFEEETVRVARGSEIERYTSFPISTDDVQAKPGSETRLARGEPEGASAVAAETAAPVGM